jgi:Zn-dependent protease
MVGRQVTVWSVTLGRFWGVPVRLHIFFLIFIVLTLAVTAGDMLGPGLITVGILLTSLLLHEFAHTAAAIKLGGQVDQIVIGPFGGLSSPRVPDQAEVQVFVALAGPMVHLSLIVLAAIGLSFDSSVHVLGLLQPFVPSQLVDSGQGSSWVLAGKLTLWLNWMLLLLNLLPAYPFDGGPALRAALWPLVGRRTACIVTSRVAMGIAVGLALLPLFIQHPQPHPTLPLWIPLVTLAIFLFFSAQQDLASLSRSGDSEETPDYDVQGDGVDLLDELWAAEEDTVLVEQRSDRRRQRRKQVKRAEEEYEDARVDDVLARLHQSSLDRLTGEERALLHRASERYRHRYESQEEDSLEHE